MMGWECPKCNRCYAPTILACWNCGPNMTTSAGLNKSYVVVCSYCGKNPCDRSGTGCVPNFIGSNA